jgi:hypothetical protein
MRKTISVILTIALIIFVSCNQDTGEFNKSDLEQLITDAISGDQQANLKLHGLISKKHTNKKDINQIFVDELKSGNRTYFSVILEYPDPKLNLFAIYDNELNLYLIDKSLNGYLNSKLVENDSKKYVFLQEQFLTKDVLSIDRISIYEIKDNTAWLVYRVPSRFVKNNNLFYQRVETITDNFIITKISGLGSKITDIKVDTFYFNPDLKKYLSNNNLFENYVTAEINNFDTTISKSQIIAPVVESENDITTKPLE